MSFPRCGVCFSGPIGCDCPVFRPIKMTEVKTPQFYTKEQALELALEHVRGYNDRMYLQFLISVEKRK